MPGEEDHERTIRAFREIVLIEGKRPDLVAYELDAWNALDQHIRETSHDWPLRRLDNRENEALKMCCCGIEVKNSTWHYTRRREAGGGDLAVTVKDEELHDISAWEKKAGRPVLFMQVLFDQVYCMSFRRMLEAIERGHLYAEGDYIAETDRKSNKHYHRFFLQNDQHLCATTVFPSESQAVVSILPNGNIIPYIKYGPAATSDVNPDVIETEIAYSL